MPHRVWSHKCSSSDGAVVSTGSEVCSYCGKKGEYAGWGYTGIEAMYMYRKATGIPPVGPHRKTMPVITRSCPSCGGKGLIDINSGEGYKICRECKGTGHVLTVTEEELTVIREKAMRIFNQWIEERKRKGKRIDLKGGLKKPGRKSWFI